MNCLFSGAIARIGGAQKRAGGVASAKYSVKPDIAIGLAINDRISCFFQLKLY